MGPESLPVSAGFGPRWTKEVSSAGNDTQGGLPAPQAGERLGRTREGEGGPHTPHPCPWSQGPLQVATSQAAKVSRSRVKHGLRSQLCDLEPVLLASLFVTGRHILFSDPGHAGAVHVIAHDQDRDRDRGGS